VLDRPGFADHLPGLGEHLHHLLLGPAGPLSCDAGVALARLVGFEPLGRVLFEPSVTSQARARRQVELAPPGHVGGVAERADHRYAGAFVGLRERMRVHRHLDAEHRCAHGRAEQRLVPLVVGVRDQRDTAHHELGACGVDENRIRPVGPGERELVIRARAFTVLEFCLGDSGL